MMNDSLMDHTLIASEIFRDDSRDVNILNPTKTGFMATGNENYAFYVL